MPRELDLGGTWQLQPVAHFDGNYGDRWLPAPVPGHWQQVPGLERHTGKVVYRRAFDFAPVAGRRYFLRINGAFYWSIAYLNGARLGANEGYFFPVDYEITDILHEHNELLIELDCPDEPDKTNKRQITGVFHHWDCLDPAANPGGLWLPVEIISTGPARLIDPSFRVLYLARNNASARVSGRVIIDTPEPARLTVRISFIPRNFEGKTATFERRVHKSAGSHPFQYEFDVPEPRLWWTHDHGRPDLYTLRVEAIPEGDQPSDVFETPFGFRTVDLRNYICILNGRRLYLRGNNYPPGDTRLATMTRPRIDEDLRLAKECNLNLLRVHAHVDHPLFYEACDEAGILLWQDFPLQWYYRPEIEAQAIRQVERMIVLLGNHPSIAAWCMHNEPLAMYDSHKPLNPVAILRFARTIFFPNRIRDRMDPALARRARFLDPHRFVTRCSGERGLFKKPGDAHIYNGWYFGPLRWFHRVYARLPERLRFVTEFGSQSFPNLESARRFMADALDRVDWKNLQARHHYQPFFMKLFVNPKRYPDLAAFIAATQDYQSELNHYYIERIRALKYQPSGGLAAFLLLDSNPAVQWSLLDYWRVPKSSYHEMKKAMSPVAAFAILDRPSYPRNAVARIPVYAVNDKWEPAEVKVRLRVVSPVGDVILDETYAAALPADSMAQALAAPEIKLRWEGEYRLQLELEGPDGTLRREYQLKGR